MESVCLGELVWKSGCGRNRGDCEIFSLAHWAGNDAVKPRKEYRRYWAGVEHGDTSVTTRGRVQEDAPVLGLLPSMRGSGLFVFSVSGFRN